MDVRESLSHIATAMRTLEFVVERFKTIAMKEALKTARFLIRLSKKRKDEDSEVLGMTLIRDPMEESQPERPKAAHMSVNGNTQQSVGNTPKTTSSSEDWNLDILNNSDFDWNFCEC